MDLKNLENQTLYDLHSTLEDANRIIEEIVEYNKQMSKRICDNRRRPYI